MNSEQRSVIVTSVVMMHVRAARHARQHHPHRHRCIAAANDDLATAHSLMIPFPRNMLLLALLALAAVVGAHVGLGLGLRVRLDGVLLVLELAGAGEFWGSAGQRLFRCPRQLPACPETDEQKPAGSSRLGSARSRLTPRRLSLQRSIRLGRQRRVVVSLDVGLGRRRVLAVPSGVDLILALVRLSAGHLATSSAWQGSEVYTTKRYLPRWWRTRASTT